MKTQNLLLVIHHFQNSRSIYQLFQDWCTICVYLKYLSIDFVKAYASTYLDIGLAHSNVCKWLKLIEANRKLDVKVRSWYKRFADITLPTINEREKANIVWNWLCTLFKYTYARISSANPIEIFNRCSRPPSLFPSLLYSIFFFFWGGGGDNRHAA